MEPTPVVGTEAEKVTIREVIVKALERAAPETAYQRYQRKVQAKLKPHQRAADVRLKGTWGRLEKQHVKTAGRTCHLCSRRGISLRLRIFGRKQKVMGCAVHREAKYFMDAVKEIATSRAAADGVAS